MCAHKFVWNMSVYPVMLGYLTRGAKKADYGEVCLLDNKPLEFIRFMGQVVAGSMEREGPTTLYSVRDALSGAEVPILMFSRLAGSEPEDVFAEVEVAPDEVLEPDVYYTFHGVPRFLSTARGSPPTHIHVDVYSSRKVVDMNELTFHGLDCIHSHLQRK